MSELTEYIKKTQSIASTPFGEAMIKAIEESEMEKEAEDDEELKEKFKEYKEAEKSHNLLQIPFLTWTKLPEICQAKILATLDPLRWGAIYVKFDEFMEFASDILQYIEPDEEYIIYSEYGCYVLLHQQNFGTITRVPSVLSRSLEKRLLSKKSFIVFKMKDGVLNVKKETDSQS